MGRNTLRTAAVVTLAALFVGTAASATYAAAPEEVNTPAPVDYEAGRYIVLLEDEPAATYTGGEPGLAPTQPDKGKRLDADDANVKKYTAFLKKQQKAVAAEAAVAPDTQYVLTLNGFAANLSAAEAGRLAKVDGVQSVTPDFVRHPDAVPSTEFLGLEGDQGVWAATGDVATAGAGVVVGVIDTGIASKNPSFAGAPLGTTPSATEPYLVGNDIVFNKADGTQFKSTRSSATENWSNDDYSTKLIGAQHFSAGAAAAGYDFTADFLSPQDWDGHGSHTAGTAAGNHDVPTTVEGIDFGTISGVAPAAKVAAYKACYAGPDVLVTTDDICAGSDLLAAIEAATKDGVDVINYSIGGGAATSTFTAEDYAFLRAAAAGIFVAVSAGNSGPDASTADHASPWYTTVAASTVPTYEGTVTAGDFVAVGASVSVPFGETLTDDAVYAGDIAAAGADPAEAALCFLDTIDPAKAEGKIVVCDRGTNARVEKSQAVEEAGGVGMVLVNVTPGSLDNDFHSVPTVHIQSTFRDELLAAVRAGTPVTLHGDNITDDVTPTPVVAGFSSRGPMLADGSDVLKPDISAPGVAILAAEGSDGTTPTFGFKSGTSMSSPHIAGLAALYLGERPNASPAEIKSAMMTTAYNTKNDDGSEKTDPFAHGAGHVDPTKYFEPGLLYLNGAAEWLAYVEGNGYGNTPYEPIDGSDLNIASIAIGSLSSAQTVTRTVTATTAGTYTAAVDVEGIQTTVSPSSVTLAAGESKTVEITFAPGTAPAEEWATGFLTWTGPKTVRSPIAVFPVTADAPLEVAGTGLSGTTTVTITPGITGELPLNLSGLTAMQLLTDPEGKVKGHTGNELSGAGERVRFFVTVPEGTELSRFDLDSSDDEGSDLDLFVYRVVSEADTRYYEMWQSASASADEQVTVVEPVAGLYMVEADVYSTTKPMTWDLTYANAGSGKTTGTFTASPNPLPVVTGTPVDYTLSWSKLKKETTYLGVVRYGDSDVRTIVTVESGSKK
ncbi:MAG TPA: S8 family serine peptidase [Microbacterium sp.]|nr:S8 family serine peptidase [Microbacterium sp.]